MASVEDFGIAPLEAMACGRPAIVFGEGGGLETVTEGVTGLVFREPTAASLRSAVDSLQALSFNRDTLRARAQEFRLSAFVDRIRAFVSSHAPGLC
jgi:glycosyltransferase involved in cell wall biosynthesis